MKQVVGWIIFIMLLVYAYQTGWITYAIDSVQAWHNNAKQTQVYQEDDGTVTTVRYRSLGDIITGK